MQIAFVTFNADPKHSKAVRNMMKNASDFASLGYRVSVLHCLPVKGMSKNLTYVRLGRQDGPFESVYRRFLTEVDQHITTNCFNVVYSILPILRCGIYEPYDDLAQESVAKTGFLSGWFNRKKKLFADVERDLLSLATPPIVLCHSREMASRITAAFNIKNIAVIPRASRPL